MTVKCYDCFAFRLDAEHHTGLIKALKSCVQKVYTKGGID